MSLKANAQSNSADLAPGDDRPGAGKAAQDIGVYLIGLALASGLTLASFYILQSKLVWAPAIPVALVVFAIAQMGVHLVFFLHITTGPDNTNNVLALAFGVLIVFLVIGGSLFIMSHLDRNMMPMTQVMQMQR
jgi:cytochrome o ubiquinol oxidase operon protein cyoD